MEPTPQAFSPDPAAYQGMMQAMSQQTGWNGFAPSMWDKAQAAMKSEWDTAKSMLMNPLASLGGFGDAFASGMVSDSLQGMMAQGIDMLTFNYFDLTSVTPMYGHQQACQQGQWIGWTTVMAEELAISYGAAAAIHAGRTAHWGLKLCIPWIAECGYVTVNGLAVSGYAMVWVHAGTVSGATLGYVGLTAGMYTVAMSNGSAGLPFQEHHYATDKHGYYTPKMEEIASRFKLKLDESWNKEVLPQCGRHPHQYHEMVLRAMMEAVAKAGGSKEKFLECFETLVKEVVRRNPDLLRKSGWM
jgi:hypothetical protein